LNGRRRKPCNDAVLQRYSPEAFFDEMFTEAGQVRPHYRRFQQCLEGLPLEEFHQKRQAVDLAYPILGAFWLAIWLPALAVAVAERGSAASSLGRSLDLTRGSRWTLGALCLGLQWVGDALALLIAVALTQAGLTVQTWWLEFITLPLWAFSSVTQAAVYWELIRLKTGLAPAGDESVFS